MPPRDTFFVGGPTPIVPNPQKPASLGPLQSLLAGASQGFLSSFQKALEKGPEEKKFTPEDLGLENVPFGLSGEKIIDPKTAVDFLLKEREREAKAEAGVFKPIDLVTEENIEKIKRNPKLFEVLNTPVSDLNEAGLIASRALRQLDKKGLSVASIESLAFGGNVTGSIKEMAKAWQAIPKDVFTKITGIGIRLVSDITGTPGTGVLSQFASERIAAYNQISESTAEKLLRKATGAATNIGEKKEYRKLMPQVADRPALIEVKINDLSTRILEDANKAIIQLQGKGDERGVEEVREYIRKGMYADLNEMSKVFLGKPLDRERFERIIGEKIKRIEKKNEQIENNQKKQEARDLTTELIFDLATE